MRGAIASIHRAPRFHRGLDMLMGKAELEDDARPFPQKLQAFHLLDMSYQPFYLSEESLRVKEVEAATDAIGAELTAFLASRAQVLRLMSTAGWSCPERHPTRTKITITGRQPSLYEMAKKTWNGRLAALRSAPSWTGCR